MAARRNARTRPAGPKPRQRALRRVPDLDEIINVTIDLLARHGESGFRIEELQERTGINKSSLYLRFGDRDGLLAAAYSEVFKKQIQESIDGLRPIVERADTPAALRVGLHAATAFVISPQRFERRLERAAIIAGVRGRPEFRKALRAAQTELSIAMAKMLDDAASRGLIRLRYPSRVAAQFIQAMTFGRIIAEIEDVEDSAQRDIWIALCNDLLDKLLFEGLLDG